MKTFTPLHFQMAIKNYYKKLILASFKVLLISHILFWATSNEGNCSIECQVYIFGLSHFIQQHSRLASDFYCILPLSLRMYHICMTLLKQIYSMRIPLRLSYVLWGCIGACLLSFIVDSGLFHICITVKKHWNTWILEQDYQIWCSIISVH